MTCTWFLLKWPKHPFYNQLKTKDFFFQLSLRLLHAYRYISLSLSNSSQVYPTATLTSETIANPKYPRRRELEYVEMQKALIENKTQALVCGELYYGLGFVFVQALGFMRLTFWNPYAFSKYPEKSSKDPKKHPEYQKDSLSRKQSQKYS